MEPTLRGLCPPPLDSLRTDGAGEPRSEPASLALRTGVLLGLLARDGCVESSAATSVSKFIVSSLPTCCFQTRTPYTRPNAVLSALVSCETLGRGECDSVKKGSLRRPGIPSSGTCTAEG